MRAAGLAVVAAASLLLSGAAVTATPTAARAAGCAADTCTGLWPAEEGCITSSVRRVGGGEVSFTITGNDHVPEFIGNAALMYSPACRSTWAEFTFSKFTFQPEWTEPSPQFWRQPQYGGTQISVLGKDPATGNNVPFLRVGTGTPVQFRTPMSSWTDSVQMCVFHLNLGEDAPTPNVFKEETDGSCTTWL